MTTAHTPSPSHTGQRQAEGPIRDVALGNLLREAAAAIPDRIALVDAVEESAARRSWTYAEFLRSRSGLRGRCWRRSPRVTGSLSGRLTGADWIVLQQGISLAGMILVAVNPAYRARELEYVLRQSGSAGLFHTDSYRGFDTTSVTTEVQTRCPNCGAWSGS